MDSPRKILLVRLDGIGDALACIPALEGLRRAIPGARFGAVCSAANAPLFSRSRMDAIHVYEGPESEAAVLAELRPARYSDVIVATEEPVGYRLASGSGARRRAGFWHRFEKTFKSIWQYFQLTDAVYRPAAWVDEPEHEVVALYGLARALGAVAEIPNDAARLRQWLDVASGDPAVTGDTLAFQVTAKLERGGWGPAGLAALALATLDGSPLRRCAFLCGAADEGLARAVMEQVPSGDVESGRAALVAPSGLAGWLGSLERAGVVVTPDTGAAHAAGILGVPVVDLFEPERYAQLSRQWRPWAAPSRCLVKPPYTAGAEAALGAEAAAAVTSLLTNAGDPR
jgi:ADP-heptose:LPS heptosyltransferase